MGEHYGEAQRLKTELLVAQRATSGATFVARRAGIQQANKRNRSNFDTCTYKGTYSIAGGNRRKCRKHGVSKREIESLFGEGRPVTLLPDVMHSGEEPRFRAIGNTHKGRYVFVVFAIRAKKGRSYIRPISARYMHRREIEHYEKENPGL